MGAQADDHEAWLPTPPVSKTADTLPRRSVRAERREHLDNGSPSHLSSVLAGATDLLEALAEVHQPIARIFRIIRDALPVVRDDEADARICGSESQPDLTRTMFPRKSSRFPIIASLAVLSFVPAHAALIITGAVSTAAETDNSVASGVPTAGTYSSMVSSTDLINSGSPTLSSASWDKTPFFESNTVNDGTGHPATGTVGSGTYLPETFGGGGKLPFTYTATLNFATHTFGYDLQTIKVFAGWNQNGASLANVKFEVLISLVGSAGFTSLGTHEYSPFGDASTQEAAASMVTLQNDTGSGTTPFATGVDQIRFVFLNHGFDTADLGNSGVAGTVLHEIDVLG